MEQTQSASQHTPGPWSTGIAPAAVVVYGDSTMPRTVVARIPNKDYPRHAIPDARLISAAPDLLAALQFLLTASGEQLTTAFEQAQEAVAKATRE